MIENDRLLDQIIFQDIVNIVGNSSLDINTFVNVNSFAAMNDSVNYVEICNKCLKLEAELIKQHNMIEKDEYNRLLKSFSKLEQHYISLEIAMQLNKEIFQKNNTFINQTKPSFDQLFELNNLKDELQAKDTTIEKLKANIKRLNKTSTTNNVKKDIDEVETINIELEHRVAKLIAENDHLKQAYKQLCDSIKPSRKSCHNNIKNDLRKFKGKDIVDNVAQVSNATTIPLGMYKLDPVTLAPNDKNNRETHIYYLKHTMEQVAIHGEIVEQAKSLNPLDSASYSACKYVKLIQEFLGYVRDTCPDIHKPRVSRSTKSSRSKSTDNTKNDRILQISSKTKKKNKVEDHSRIIISMFDARHELCFLEFVSDMNVSSKSKPTGRTFTLVGNACPLTRITATNKVPLRKPIPLEVIAQESVVTKVYNRRPKVPRINGSNSQPKIAKSMISNKTKPDTSRGSNTSVAPSSSSVDLSCLQRKASTDAGQEDILSGISLFYDTLTQNRMVNNLRSGIFNVPIYAYETYSLQQLKQQRNIPPVAAMEEVETITQHTAENKLYFTAENEAIFLDSELVSTGDNYYQAPKPQRSHATSSSTRPSASTRHKGKEIAKPITPQSESVSEEDSDPEQAQRDKDMQKNLALLAKYFKKLYKPTNNNLRTSSNSRNKTEDTTPRYNNDNQSGQFGTQRTMTVAGARETVGSPVVQQNGIQCFNCKGFGHYARECRKLNVTPPKWVAAE
ncbi:retrovirus-related pol polyprotein from transposon TNT 1-94 [Tanacetum coccineum]